MNDNCSEHGAIPDSGCNECRLIHVIIPNQAATISNMEDRSEFQRHSLARCDQARANALATIATLVEACKKALTCASLNSDVADLLRAAIAKAKGTTP